MTRRPMVLLMVIVGCSRGSGNADSTARAESAAAAGIPSPAAGTVGSDTSLARAGVDTAGRGATASQPTPPSSGTKGRPPAGSSTGARPPAGDSNTARSDAADTARGIVAVVGTSFESRVVLRPAMGGRTITLGGPQAKTVGRLSGTDVWVTGSRDASGQITVSRFVVRTVNGQPALDGTLIMRGDQLFIVTRDGKQHPITSPPPALRDRVGARVWVVGPPDRPPVTFGVIEERG
jgi:hypothetical protein